MIREATFQPVIRFILCACSFLFFSGCSPLSSKNPVLYQVGSLELHEQDFRARLMRNAYDHNPLLLENPETLKILKKRVLEDFTMEALLLHWDAKQKKPITTDEVLAQMGRIRPSGLNPQEKKSDSSFFRQTKASLAKERLIQSFPPNETGLEQEFRKAKTLYWSDKGSYRSSAQIQLQQIVVGNELQAAHIFKSLKEGQIGFDEAAKQYSMGPEAPRFGHLGWIRRGTLDVFDQAFSLKEGKISKPIQSAYGYHLFKVLKKSKSRKVPLEDVKRQLRQKTINKWAAQAYKKWFEEELSSLTVLKDDTRIDQIQLVLK